MLIAVSTVSKSQKEAKALQPCEESPEPSGSNWSRARRPEQKKARRDAILAAALSLLDDSGLESTSLSAIARASGISKANIYRYFESREAILLEVTLDEVQAWLEEITRRLAPLSGSGDVAAVAELFATTVGARPRACTLVSSLALVLERNVSVEVIADFKRRFNALGEEPVNAVHAALPELSLEDSAAFMSFFSVFVAGVWPVCNPAPAVAEVLARPEFSGMCIEFETVARAHANTVLRGLCRPA